MQRRSQLSCLWSSAPSDVLFLIDALDEAARLVFQKLDDLATEALRNSLHLLNKHLYSTLKGLSLPLACTNIPALVQ